MDLEEGVEGETSGLVVWEGLWCADVVARLSCRPGAVCEDAGLGG